MNTPLYSLPTVFIVGLVFGLGPCTITCLPFLGPVFLARTGGLRQSWKTIVPFSLGRLFSYTSLGFLSAVVGSSVQTMIHDPLVSWFLGGATITVGLVIFYRTYQRRPGCSSHGKPRKAQTQPLLPSGLFFMGLGMAATPCAPLATVMLVAATNGNGLSGFLLGLCFGLGAVIIPALVFGIGMAYFGQRIRQILFGWRTTLERASGLMLVLTGFNSIAW